MDYVTRQFIVLAKKLREDLRRSLQNQTNAISQAAKAATENKQQPLPLPLPVRAELQLPEADKRENREQYNQSHTVQIWLTVGTWLAFVAASVYAGIAARQLCEMRKTVREAIRATDINAESLYSVQRAYISASISSHKDGNYMVEDISWSNAGGTPTKDMIMHVSFSGPRSTPLPEDFSFPDVRHHTGKHTANAYVPAKGQFLAGAIHIPQQMLVPPNPKETRYFYAWGWARYHDVFTDTPEHITRFCFASASYPTMSNEIFYPEVSVDACARYNCADTQCKH